MTEEEKEEMCECEGAREWHVGGTGECMHSECGCVKFRPKDELAVRSLKVSG